MQIWTVIEAYNTYAYEFCVVLLLTEKVQSKSRHERFPWVRFWYVTIFQYTQGGYRNKIPVCVIPGLNSTSFYCLTQAVYRNGASAYICACGGCEISCKSECYTGKSDWFVVHFSIIGHKSCICPRFTRSYLLNRAKIMMATRSRPASVPKIIIKSSNMSENTLWTFCYIPISVMNWCGKLSRELVFIWKSFC